MIEISRVQRPKSEARKAYDRLSPIYDWMAGTSEMHFVRIGLENLAVEPGERVLEIGCGTGKALEVCCSQAGERGLVNGLDLSPGMLQVAGSRLGKSCHGGASLVCGDGAALPYASGIFSALFMSFTLELFDTPEIAIVLAECWRVLKPGGRLGVVAMSKPASPSWIVRLYERFHARFPAYVDCRPIDTEARIQMAGFTIERRLSKSMWGLPVEVNIARRI